MSFESRAKERDNNSRIERSKVVADKINEIIGNEEYNSVMEYGCATGLISFNLCDKFKKITLMDSEKEMINIVKQKVEKYRNENIFPVQIDLMNELYKQEKFDLIYTSLTLHHIENIFESVGFSNIESDTFYNGEKIYKEKTIPYSLFYTAGIKK